MSYTVEYNPELSKSYPMRKKAAKRPSVKNFVVVVGALVGVYVLHRLNILHFFIPGDPAITAGAFSEMVDDVRAGQTVSNAVLLFFQNVISGGVS